METCPDCGAKLVEKSFSHLNQKIFYDFECKSFWVGEKRYGDRPGKCYETQITALKAQLADRDAEIDELQDHIAQEKDSFDDLKVEYNLELEDNRVLAKELADREERLALWRQYGRNVKLGVTDGAVYQALKDKGEL